MAARLRWILAAALAALPPAHAVVAEEQASDPSAKQQIKTGFKEAGRAVGRGAVAIGHVFRDGAKETWKASQPGREKVKEGGREVGHAGAKAGRAVGGAAKDAGRSVKSAAKGNGGGGEAETGE